MKASRALRHPREAALYLLLGGKAYRELRGPGGDHTCYRAPADSFPFFRQRSAPTDIHEHLVTLYMLTVELNLPRVLELGTRGGESTVALLHGARVVHGHVTSVDVEDVGEARRAVDENGLGQYWTFVKSDDTRMDWSAPIDHLFIDTSHTFEHTTAELKKFEPYVRDGGVITMHDSVAYPGLKEAFLRYAQDRADLHAYEYLNNNGLLVVFKRSPGRD